MEEKVGVRGIEGPRDQEKTGEKKRNTGPKCRCKCSSLTSSGEGLFSCGM